MTEPYAVTIGAPPTPLQFDHLHRLCAGACAWMALQRPRVRTLWGPSQYSQYHRDAPEHVLRRASEEVARVR
jgi:hypothetical protein